MASRSHSGGRSGPLGFLSSLYDLDTLDTRFTTPSSVPYRAATDKREDDEKVADKRADPPKWKSLEFYLYYLVFLTVVPYMFWVAYDVSRPSDPRYNRFKNRLAGGWVPGRKIVSSPLGIETCGRMLNRGYRTCRMPNTTPSG